MKKIAAFILPLLICAAVLSGGSLFAEEPVTISLTETAADPGSTVAVSYTHLTLPTNSRV